jgi:hypothetical protein
LDPRTNTRREVLSSAQRAQLLALPTSLRELEERYSFTPSDLEFIGAQRINSNRLGIAVQLCFLRHPGRAWTPEERIPATLQERSYVIDQKLLAHLSPLKWKHINLTGDYRWRRDGGLRNRKPRPLRSQTLPVKLVYYRTIFYKRRSDPDERAPVPDCDRSSGPSARVPRGRRSVTATRQPCLESSFSGIH